ncbi:MAG: hypothetical protein JW783_16380 [Bacteroidales bacterium]|nr:hypothetical protein [Bacteroidales bacterium]MBN2750717.1 hypothetical protein [Bacteroidales bacterium]
MRYFIVTIAALLFLHSHSVSQNLVVNGSFEEYYKCPQSFTSSYTKKFLPSWRMPTKGTPDFFNKCSKVDAGVPQNFMGSIHAQQGESYVGLVLLDTPTGVRKEINYREYLQTQLKQPLFEGKKYRLRFYYALAQNSTYSINRIGVFVSNLMVEAKKGVLNVKPQLEVDSLVFPAAQGEWVEFNQVFTAKGGERYLTIGNFYPDSKTTYASNNLDGLPTVLQKKVLTNKVAYYYIDNVSLELTPEDEPNELVPFSTFKHFSKYHIDSVFSMSQRGEAFILDELYFVAYENKYEALSLLQGEFLSLVLKEYPDRKLEFVAFLFDNETSNKKALERAERFVSYLEKRGIERTRVSFSTLDMKPFSCVHHVCFNGHDVALASKLIAIRIL